MSERKISSPVFIEVPEAVGLDGVRLVLSRGVPSPWGEAAQRILSLKAIPFVRVSQYPGQPNQALKDWARENSAPIAIYKSEPPRAYWTSILLLAERLQPKPRLVPADAAERVLMFGLANELCGEDGYGWNKRLINFATWSARKNDAEKPLDDVPSDNIFPALIAKYGYGVAGETAVARLISILGVFSDRLRRQLATGSRYLIGRQITAVDIYWAAFCALIQPLPDCICPMSAAMRVVYTESDPRVLEAADPVLLAHRDYIYESYLKTPVIF